MEPSETGVLIHADDIDEAFTPQGRATAVVAPLGAEHLLVDRTTGAVYALNAVGGALWGCFDGVTRLDELAADAADALGTPPQDLVDFVRSLGRSGLLEGVEPEVTEHVPLVSGLAIGEALGPFALVTTKGDRFVVPSRSERRTLLVNWSFSCGYCLGLVGELAELRAGLAQEGVDLVLLTREHGAEATAAAEEAGLEATMAPRPRDDDTFADPFPDMGTPVAYLIDCEGTVLDDLAFGAGEVPALARRTAGLPPQEAEPTVEPPQEATEGDTDRPRYLPSPAAAVCAPGSGASPRSWGPTRAYDLGDFYVGIRADTPEADELVARVLVRHHVAVADEPPPNYSVVLAPGSASGQARGLNLLLDGGTTVVRSRSPQRVVRALLHHLSARVTVESLLADRRYLAVVGLPAVRGGRAYLLPNALRFSDQAQPRLAVAGFSLVDVPFAVVDVLDAALVVPEPALHVDHAALELVPDPVSGRAEGGWVPPGRYPLAAWVLPFDDEDRPAVSARTAAVGAAVPFLIGAEPVAGMVAKLDTLFEQVPTVRVSGAVQVVIEAVGAHAKHASNP
ncbi:MAG: PqqD family peptide modification chaperone [Acidimicrobiales bacterium]